MKDDIWKGSSVSHHLQVTLPGWSAGTGGLAVTVWGSTYSPALLRSSPAWSGKAGAALQQHYSPSLEIFKTHLDTDLCSWLWVTLLQQGVGLGDPQRSLPTPTILGFRDSAPSAVVFGVLQSICRLFFGRNQLLKAEDKALPSFITSPA